MALFQTNAGPPKPSYEISISIGCDASVSVGDPVHQSLDLDETVAAPGSNTTKPLICGLIIAKGSPTTCKMLLLGVASGFSGLTRGLPVFLGESGEITTTVPTTGNLQILGKALSATKILFNPQLHKVIRT